MNAILPLVAQTPQQMPVGASWVVIGDWADAAVELFGDAAVITPEQCYAAAETREFATLFSKPRSSRSGWKNLVPESAITLAKDARALGRSLWAPQLQVEQLNNCEVPFVWQHHSMFQSRGLKLARRLGVPCVIGLEALQIQEARVWGHRRLGWASLLEQVAEVRSLRAADLVTCVSDELVSMIEVLGVSPDRVMATPNKASISRFQSIDTAEARRRFAAGDELRIGWVGSFRQFHGLDRLIDAFARIKLQQGQSVKLILAGDGPERLRLIDMAKSRYSALDIDFCGPLPYADVPAFLRSLDIGMVSAAPGQQFHYSPLKLEELMASAVATVAPGVGQIARQLSHHKQAALYDPSDLDSLVRALQHLVDDVGARDSLARAGFQHVQDDGGTVGQLKSVVERLDYLKHDGRPEGRP